jgi:hypothetical protein
MRKLPPGMCFVSEIGAVMVAMVLLLRSLVQLCHYPDSVALR